MNKRQRILVLFCILTFFALTYIVSGQVSAGLFDDYQRYLKVRMLMFKVMNLSGGAAPVGSPGTGPTPTPSAPVRADIVDSSTGTDYGDSEYIEGQGSTITIRYPTTRAIPTDKQMMAWLKRPDSTWLKLGILVGPGQGNIYALRYIDLQNLTIQPIIITQEVKTPEPTVPDIAQVIVNLTQQPTTPTPTP